MGKCRSICFFITLILPGLCTLGLLIFSILTNNWIRIRNEQVNDFKQKSIIEFESYKTLVDNGQKNIDYLFIEKQWPLIRHKGLYSSCIKYEPFYLKISMSFLINAKKSTIKAGIIHYPKYIIDSYEKLKNTKTCNQSNFVYCYSTEECVEGKLCDGKSDCLDQTDEQLCEETQCESERDNIRFHCDKKCWHSSQVRANKQPRLCLNQTDEEILWKNKNRLINLIMYSTDNNLKANDDDNNDIKKSLYKLGDDKYNEQEECYEEYFNFEESKEIDKDDVKSLTQQIADNIQEEYKLDYYLHIIYVISFILAALFALLAVLTLFFLVCLRKLCLQCPYWFFGFFTILTLLSCASGLAAFLYSFYINHHKSLDPLRQLQLTSEIYRLNPELKQMQTFCMSFWSAGLATLICLLSTILSFIICCRLPSSRHEDKDYHVIQFN